MPKAIAVSLCLALLVFATGCNEKRRQSLDLIANASHGDLAIERVGRLLLTESDDPDLVEGWSDFEQSPEGGPAVWTVGERSRLRFYLNDIRPLQLRFSALPINYPGRDKAQLEISLNGSSAGRVDLMDSWRSYAVSLPARGLRLGANELVFDHPWALPPVSTDGSGELRKLALNFTDLRITDDGAPPGPEVVTCPRGAVPGLATGLHRAGNWADAEMAPVVGEFHWMTGTDAELEFELPADLTCGVRLRIPLMPLTLPAHAPQWVAFTLNGYRLARLGHRQLLPGWQTIELNLHRDALRAGHNVLALQTAYALRPSDVTDSKDTRRLSIAAAMPVAEWLPSPGRLLHPAANALVAPEGHLLQPAGSQIGFALALPKGTRLRLSVAKPQHADRLRIFMITESGERLDVLDRQLRDATTLEVKLPMRKTELAKFTLAWGRAGGDGALEYQTLELTTPGSLEGWTARESAPRTAAPPVTRRPGTILVYLVDTLRADHLTPYGYPRETSSGLARFALESTRYENAWSVTSWTKAATASVLTGLPPHLHGADSSLSPLRPDVSYLPTQLKAVGYRTAAVIGNPYVGSDFGFQRDFDDFRFVYSEKNQNQSSSVANDALRNILKSVGPEQPLFVYMHTVDPHSPYMPDVRHNLYAADAAAAAGNRETIYRLQPLLKYGLPVGNQVRVLSDLYDGEIHNMDAAFANTLDILRNAKRYDDALIVFLSDHGEEFGEHRGLEHGQTLFTEVTHIPLLIRWPQGGRRDPVVTNPVSQLDVFPTVMAAAGVPVTGAAGNDLTELAPAHRRLVSQLDYLNHREVRIVDGQWSYHWILDRTNASQYFARPMELLFDLSGDPGQSRNLAGDHPLLVDYFRGIARGALTDDVAAASEVNSDVLRQLKALGYLQ